MDDYLVKPVNRKSLVNALLRWTGDAVETEALGDQGASVASTSDDRLFDEKVLEQLAEDTAPELIPELTAAFEDDSLARLKKIAETCEKGDIESLGKEVHALGSSAGTFGAMRLHDSARQIESLCREGEKASALKKAGLLGETANQSLAALNDYVNSMQSH